MYIKFSDLVEKNFNENSIRRLITYTNADIMDTAVCMIVAQNIDESLRSACKWFATSLYVTYHSDKIQEMLNVLDEDSTTILNNCSNDKNLLSTIAYEIGTNSEGNTNYSVMERMVLICAAAKHVGYKFDFSWNL